MENDSLNENVMASGAKQSLDVDSSVISAPEIELPSPEQLGISIVSGPEGGMPAVTVGDTFDFPVTVSWSVQGSALLVVPTGSANAKGLTQVGMSQESARSVKDGKEIASITFTYKIVAEDTGALNVPAMRFEIPTQVGRPLDLRSESVAVRVNEPFNPLPIAVGLVVFLAFVYLKAGLYALVNWTFFDTDSNQRWMRGYLLMTALTAFLFYPLLLLDVFAHLRHEIVIGGAILVVIMYELLLFYKLNLNFRARKYGYMLIFLYFCTVELIPTLVLGHLAVWFCDNYLDNNILY